MLFEVTYINMDTNEERTIPISVPEGILEAEIDGYIYAIRCAFEQRKSNECFSKLEFIAG